MAEVRIAGLRKRYGSVEAVRGIDLDIADGEFIVLVGASGCGKSTTLRMIAGLEEISDGEIWIGDRLVNELPSKERDIAMVFQDYALYPHMSVYDNISFGLRYRISDRAEIKRRVEQAAEILGLTPLLDRKPRQLSGGQRQRVAMGRAIVRDPLVFLFDEPLSNLDAKLRVQMRTEIKRLHNRVRTTFVHVTHDQVEAMTLADRIVLMRNGEIEQIGTPDEIYSTPKTAYVASFIGAPPMNLIPAIVDRSAKPMVRFGEVSLPLSDALSARAGPDGRKVTVGLRPEHFVTLGPRSGASASLPIKVDVVEPLGSDTLLFFSLAGVEGIARVPPEQAVRQGERMMLEPNLDRIVLFDAETGKAL
ncbi:MAG: sn-glycerol-3-phosphate ABC transporter ATP-binding protein UgpC [Rhizobiales bacterium]|nr:sn-glycerol-3-phosphate ABC transporter ATP-binding protein UgpC [Hyphomicrobiales bacterium]